MVTHPSSFPAPPKRRLPPRETLQGTAIRQVLVNQNGFRSAQDIYAVLRADGRHIGLSTVYRHLQALVEQGLADVIHGVGDGRSYRLSAGTEHHLHLVCRLCRRAEEVSGREIEQWADELAHAHRYTEIDCTVEVLGVCADCASRRSRSV